MSDTVIPDVGGQQVVVDAIYRLLMQAAMRRTELEVARVANGHSEDDPAPGHQQTRPDGTVNSYRLLIEELREQERRLVEAYPDEMERVREIVASREEAKR